MLEAAPELARENARIMAAGSKSFSFAAAFFDRPTREAARTLYRWCRRCDDDVDLARDAAEAQARAALLRARLNQALAGEASDPEFAGLARLRAAYGIPGELPGHLIDGFEFDSRFAGIEDEAELELYCYRVAGAVGEMMARIMGASNADALRSARDLGIAMQMTNIARDVAEDHERGRVYLPKAWLRAEGVEPERLWQEPARVHSVVARLLAEADRRYRSGYEGLRWLPWRSAIAISAAGSVYSAIGRKALRGGPAALRKRATLSFVEKCFCLIGAFARAARRRWP